MINQLNTCSKLQRVLVSCESLKLKPNQHKSILQVENSNRKLRKRINKSVKEIIVQIFGYFK